METLKTDVDATSFTDLLFNLILGYAFLFIISFLLIQPIVKKAEVHTQAEFIIKITWPINNKDDVDVWLEDPIGNLVFFRNKEQGLMHLDRDDLGNANDVVFLPDGSMIKYPYNQEIMTIRGFIPGEWILNLHMYTKRELGKITPVTVEMNKLNPNVRPIISRTIDMSEQFEEITIARLEMAGNGDIISIDDLPKKLVKVGHP